jgi:lipoteichoic acid synthase
VTPSPQGSAKLTLLSTESKRHLVRETVALAVVLLACRAHRLLVTRDWISDSVGASAAAAARGMAADLVFILAHAFIWFCVLTPPRWGPLLVIPLRFVSAVFVALSLADHAFLLSTGATLDWHILRYGLAHFGELWPILMHAGGSKLAFTAAIVMGIVLLPEAIRCSRLGGRFGGWLARTEGTALWQRFWLPLSVVSFALVAQSCIRAPQSTAEAPQFLLQNVHFRLTKTAFVEAARGVNDQNGPATNQPSDEKLVETRRDRHYNIVLVILESARARSLSPYANGTPTTPFFQELSQKGSLIENAYAVIPHTTKALVSIQCGIYPRLDPEPYEAIERGIPVRCLPNLLRDVGYTSAFFQPAEENFERRKDLVREFGYDLFAGKQSLGGAGFDESNYLGFEDKVLVRPVMEWVDRQARPFLLTVLTLASHHPYSIPTGFGAKWFVEERSENEYLNTIAYTDEFLHDLFREFELRRLLDDTVFVVLGDHGEAFGEHDVRQHDAVPYEEGLRVPMVLVGPPFRRGRRIAGLRQSIDVLPTVLEASGFRLESPVLPGLSMLSSRGHERLYFSCHYRDYCLATRDSRKKVIHHYGRRGPEFFDLLVDPDERINLAPHRSLEVGARIEDVRAWKERVNAQFSEGRRWQVTRDVSLSPPSVSHELAVDFGADVRLLGFDIDRKELTAGEQLVISHHFFVARKPDPAMSLIFHLMGPRSEDLTHVPVAGSYPLSQWKPGEYVTDRYTYFARPGTPQGEYRLMVGLWRHRASSAADAEVHPRAPGARIDDERRIETAAWQVVAPTFEREEYVHAALPEGWGAKEVMMTSEIGLVGCRLSKSQIKRGVKTTLSCLYHALRDNPVGRLCVTLRGPRVRSIAHTPLRGSYPVDEWKAGQYIRDELDLYMVTADPDGEYRIVIGVDVEEPPSASHDPCDAGKAGVDTLALTLSE